MTSYRTKQEGKLDYRFVKPRETYQIMGFGSKDLEKTRDEWLVNKILTKECLYKHACNSIAINVLEGIFKVIDHIESREIIKSWIIGTKLEKYYNNFMSYINKMTIEQLKLKKWVKINTK